MAGRFAAAELLGLSPALPPEATAHGALLLGRGDDSAAIIVYAPKDPSGLSQSTLSEFVKVNGEMINKMLKQTQANQ